MRPVTCRAVVGMTFPDEEAEVELYRVDATLVKPDDVVVLAFGVESLRGNVYGSDVKPRVYLGLMGG